MSPKLKDKIKFILKIALLIPPYLRDICLQSFKKLPPNNKNIIFYFNDSRMFKDNDNSGREAFQMMKTFSDGGGYNVYFLRSQGFLEYYRLRKYGRLIYKIRNLKFIKKLPEHAKDFIYAFDTPQPEVLARRWKRLLYINIEKAPTYQIGNVIPVPFCMHPYIYTSKADEHLFDHREYKRKLRIFFGGNFHKDYYNSPIFKQRYPEHLTRLEAAQVLIKSGLNVSLINQLRDLQWFLSGPKPLNQMVLFDSKSTFPIKPRQWLKILGQCDFFMGFSGTSYPMCHNVIEAMSVGTIPILSYYDWFDPELEHGKNAIIYTDKDDLIRKIHEVFSMKPQEIERLRRGVLNYYDTYLTEEHLVRKYEHEGQKISTIMRFPRFVLTDKDNEEGKVFSAKMKTYLPHLFPKEEAIHHD